MASTPRILVVDDEAGIRETMGDILTLEGYDVTAVESGEKAIESCGRERYDFALVDFRMPGLNGLETLREIKRLAPDTKGIIITGADVGPLAKQAMEEGAEALFRKPLDVAMFLPLLSSMA